MNKCVRTDVKSFFYASLLSPAFIYFQVYEASFYLLILRENKNNSEIENENICGLPFINAICIFADGKAFNVGNLFVITIYREERGEGSVTVRWVV